MSGTDYNKRIGAPDSERTLHIGFTVEEPRWRAVSLSKLRRAAKLALLRGQGSGELTILLSSDERLCALNARHRGKQMPTNVLAFPAGGRVTGYLGDVAIAYGVAETEAEAVRKPLADHAAHLVVHGVLHLVGYDHMTRRQTRLMETLEVDILHEIGIANPYLPAVAAE
jgi:probable rRNA maturation factor